MNKFELINKVLISNLDVKDKPLLIELIVRANDEGKCYPSVERLCKVRGIKHERNFKGVDVYLPGLVTKVKTGRSYTYYLNTSAIEEVLEAQVEIKHTPRLTDTSAGEEVNTSATADNTSATEEVNTSAVEGANSSIDNTEDSSIDSTGTTVPDGPVDEILEEESSSNSKDTTPLGIQESSNVVRVDSPPNKEEDKAAIKERWIAAHTFNGVLYRKDRDLENAKRQANTDWWDETA